VKRSVAAADASRTPLASTGDGSYGGGFFIIPMSSGGSGDGADASVDGFG
jgi:hypothetical protein